MLTSVPVGTRKIEEYAQVVGDEAIEELRRKASKLKGLRVLNISSTAFGGGVAELLYTKVPLMTDLGLDVKWQVIGGDTPFFTATKNIHNGLQGMDFLLTDHMIDIYEAKNKSNAQALTTEADIYIVHDPQPMAMVDFLNNERRKKGKWIWRAHIDLTEPQAEVLNYVSKFTSHYDAVVMTLEEYAKDGNLMVEAELPGVSPADVTVKLRDNMLMITGERKAKREVTEKDVYRVETSYVKFKRQISLPAKVKPEEIKATFANGILTVDVPKAAPPKEEEKEVKIEVQ